MNPPPSALPKSVVQGPIDRVPCPSCGGSNDCRALQEQQLLDTGHTVDCDHCGMCMEVVRVQAVTIVAVRRDPMGRRAAPASPAGRAQALRQRQLQGAPKPQPAGFLQRLLGKG